MKIEYKINRDGFIKAKSAFHDYVQNVTPARFGAADTTEQAAIRITQALGLQHISIDLLSAETATLLAEVCENHLCNFRCNLQSINLKTGKWGGKYSPRFGTISISYQMNRGDTISVFIHEFAHALYAAMHTDPATKSAFRKRLMSIRKEHLACLNRIYTKAAEHVPALNEYIENLRITGFDRVYNFLNGLRKHAASVPDTILQEFQTNLVSSYALANSNEYFSEHFADYFSNPAPSVHTQRIWKLAEEMASETLVKTAPSSTWLDHTTFIFYQGVLLDSTAETMVLPCDLKRNVSLPGLDLNRAEYLRKYLRDAIPGSNSRYPKPCCVDMPAELLLNCSRILLVPVSGNWLNSFYQDAIRAANTLGIDEIAIPLYYDGRSTSFRRLVNALNETDQYMDSAALPLRKITFVAPERQMFDRIADIIPLAAQHLLPDGVTAAGHIRLVDTLSAIQVESYPKPQQRKYYAPIFTQFLAPIGTEVGTRKPLETGAGAVVVYVSQFSSLYDVQFGRGGQVGMEQLVEEKKYIVYRSGDLGVHAVPVPNELQQQPQFLILVPRSADKRQQLLLEAMRLAENLGIAEIAIPYYLYAHRKKVAEDTLNDLKFIDREFGQTPVALKNLILCASAQMDYAPLMEIWP